MTPMASSDDVDSIAAVRNSTTLIKGGEQGWVQVKKGSKITKKTDPYYVELSNDTPA